MGGTRLSAHNLDASQRCRGGQPGGADGAIQPGERAEQGIEPLVALEAAAVSLLAVHRPSLRAATAATSHASGLP